MLYVEIAGQRLFNQHLSGNPFAKPEDVVKHLGAVQAQDFAAAKWSVGMRVENATDETVERAFNEGRILRTHIMRPTWHFVSPKDIRWMQELTKNRVKQLMNTYNRKLELTDALFAKSNKVIVKALQDNNFLTRQELKKILESIGIKTDVQRLAHIIMYAELDALICSGPRRGKQFTYALLEERVSSVKKVQDDEALAKLTLKYFSSHGPSQLKDFSWWSGLTVKDAHEGLSMVKSKLREETVDGKTYWFSANTIITRHPPLTARLLSIYDEYTIAYKDRSALGGEKYVEKLLSMGNALTSVLILDGIIAGTWKRVLKKNRVEISIKPFRKLMKPEQEAIKQESERYGKFLGMPVVFNMHSA